MKFDLIDSMGFFPNCDPFQEYYGPECISKILRAWTEQYAIRLLFIQPGKPTQNAYIERFNGSYRHEVLNAYCFSNLTEVRQITEKWLEEYNEQRPHASLGYLTPKQYLQ